MTTREYTEPAAGYDPTPAAFEDQAYHYGEEHVVQLLKRLDAFDPADALAREHFMVLMLTRAWLVGALAGLVRGAVASLQPPTTPEP